MSKLSQVIVYQARDGAIELKGDFGNETIWASQSQIVKLFSVDQSVVSRHINNIFRDKEIDKSRNMQKMHNANSDKPINYYSLDVILGVGYRTNSKVAISFRQWATKTLRSHILTGYTINKKMISKNYNKFLLAVEDVKRLLPSDNSLTGTETIELIKLFASTWFSLDASDKSTMPKEGATLK